MQPDLIWIPANPANFMYGRQGCQVEYIVFHHAVSSAKSAVGYFQRPVQISSHGIVGADALYWMVDTDNTAYTNGNWAFNLRSVTLEHEGTWLNGHRNEAVIQRSAETVAWLRTLYPNAKPLRHRDIVATACPGDLPVEEIWDRATAILNPPAPTPVDDRPEWLKNRTDLVATKYANKGNVQLWNLNDPTQPADTRLFAVNTKFDIGSTTTVDGHRYFITVYSTSKNVGAGYRSDDLNDTEYSEPVQPPAVIPAPVEPPKEVPPVVVPPKEEPGTVITPAPQEPPVTKPKNNRLWIYTLIISLLGVFVKKRK